MGRSRLTWWRRCECAKRSSAEAYLANQVVGCSFWARTLKRPKARGYLCGIGPARVARSDSSFVARSSGPTNGTVRHKLCDVLAFERDNVSAYDRHRFTRSLRSSRPLSRSTSRRMAKPKAPRRIILGRGSIALFGAVMPLSGAGGGRAAQGPWRRWRGSRSLLARRLS